MNILAIDSCTTVATCAIMKDDKLIFESYLNDKNTHSEKLLPQIEYALSMAGMSCKDIDAFAVTVGPGSFTGIRIGLATIKGLAHAYDIPCIGVSALMAMAGGTVTERTICPMINARRGTVYNALYRWEGNKLVTVEPERVIPLNEILNESSAKDYIFTGTDISEFENELADFQTVLSHLRGTRASTICMLAKSMPATSAHELVPLYIQPTQAERLYQK